MPNHGACRDFLEKLKLNSQQMGWSLEATADLWDSLMAIRSTHGEKAVGQIESDFQVPATAVPEPKRKQ